MKIIILLSLLNIIYCQYTTVYTKYGNYCGYLNNNKNMEPIDVVDRCCQLHDLCCEKYGMKEIECHKRFANCIFEIAEYYELDGYPLKLYNSVKRIKECYKSQIESGFMMGGGALLMLTPLAPLGMLFMGCYKAKENNKLSIPILELEGKNQTNRSKLVDKYNIVLDIP